MWRFEKVFATKKSVVVKKSSALIDWIDYLSVWKKSCETTSSLIKLRADHPPD